MLKSIQSIGNMVAYLMTSIIPRVNAILDILGRDKQDIRVWGWEEHLHSRPFKVSRLIALSFTPTRHWLPILSVGALLIVYALMIQANNYSPSIIEFWLIAINLLLLIWAGIQNIVAARSFDRQIKRNKQ
jgi:phosphatidylglycerophosphate synthase